MHIILILIALLTLINLIIMLGRNIYDLVDSAKWKKKREQLDKEFMELLGDIKKEANSKCEEEE